MPKSNPIKQLSILNELFASAGISTPDIAEHIRRVLDFSSKEQSRGENRVSLQESVNQLVRLHVDSGKSNRAAFAHWHVPTVEQFGSLWIRQAIVVKMKQLVGFSTAFLLVTGLRESICTEGTYWTKKRQMQYDRICTWIDDLTCAWAGKDSRLQVVIL